MEELLEMSYILSINTNITDYSELMKHNDFIYKIFKYENKLFIIDYKFVEFVTQPSITYLLTYFENYNEKYSNYLKNWYKFDDSFPKFKKINIILI